VTSRLEKMSHASAPQRFRQPLHLDAMPEVVRAPAQDEIAQRPR
jgi:hypothetical protein